MYVCIIDISPESAPGEHLCLQAVGKTCLLLQFTDKRPAVDTDPGGPAVFPGHNLRSLIFFFLFRNKHNRRDVFSKNGFRLHTHIEVSS